jgi:hypothetical protein
VIKTITHFPGGHRRHPRGGQFDGQGNPVEALTSPRHRQPTWATRRRHTPRRQCA